MGAPLDLINNRFGRLVVTAGAPNRVTPKGNSRRAWLCECDCGNKIVATTLDLRKGDVQSCGCLRAELDKTRSVIHGDHGTHLYNVWRAMRRRCKNVKNSDYSHYGGRGIRVCSEWDNDYLSFKKWALGNGYSPNLTIDRIDVNGNYAPENCRWVTMKTQANNRSNSKYITCDGKTLTIKEWADMTGIRYSTLYMRIRKGLSAKEALNIN